MIFKTFPKRKKEGVLLFLFVILLSFVLFNAMNYANQQPEEEQKELSWLPYEQALAKSKVEDIPTLIYFYSDNCGWCRKLEEESFGNKEIKNVLNKGFALVKINGNSNRTVQVEGKNLTESRLSTEIYQVNAFPTIWFLNSANERISNLPGFVPSDMFLPILIYIRDDLYKKYTFQQFMELEAGKQE
jgi:thioredoxin-related protein